MVLLIVRHEPVNYIGDIGTIATAIIVSVQQSQRFRNVTSLTHSVVKVVFIFEEFLSLVHATPLAAELVADVIIF